jgi:hypothetical protein
MGVENESDRNSIIQKIKTAEAYYLKEKETFFSDRRLMELLQDLEIAIRDSRQTMGEIGIIPLCGDCEEKEGGSCCGKGLENKYSQTLLLINLLLGISLPKTRYDQKSCFFLGNKGCLLAARHVICVNYLCAKINNSISPDKILLLREKEGIELNLLFLINERVKKLLMNAE